MKLSYTRKIEIGSIPMLAVLDLTLYGYNTVWVNRINVPVSARGEGIGRALMKEMLDDADRQKVNVCLVINAHGRHAIDLDHDGLARWYGRLGFKDHNGTGLYFRAPNFGDQGRHDQRPETDRIATGEDNAADGSAGTDLRHRQDRRRFTKRQRLHIDG